MRRLSLLLLACLTLGIAWAERVSVNTAQQVAANVAAGLSPSNLRSSSDLKLVYAAPAKQQSGLRAAGNESDYYIFNVGTGDGFIIVAGEDRVRPVLGYSAEGEVDMEKIPENMKAWLEMYQKEISWAVSQGISASGDVEKEWQEVLNGTTKLRSSGGVLLETAKWNQGEPYNRMTPLFGNEHAVTGCVATSAAIVMRYHQYPDIANAEYGVTSYWQQSVEYTPYDWSKMPMDYNQGYTEEEANQVAALMWHIGANVDMRYTASESAATWEKMPSVLTDLFGYSKEVRHVYKDEYYWDEWKEMLRNELDNERPVLYDGQRPVGSGHAFVCDGYTPEGAFHFNWGWGGQSNGYFLLTTMDVDNNGNGYSERPSMIIGIHKPTSEDEAPLMLRQYSLNAVFPLPTDGSAFNVSSSALNRGNTPITGYLNIAIADASGNLLADDEGNIRIVGLSAQHISLNPNYYGGGSIQCMLPEPLSNGNMLVSVYSVNPNDKTGWVRLEGGPDVPIGLSMTEQIMQKDEANEPESPINFNTFWDQFDGSFLECTAPADGTSSSMNTKGISFNITGLASDAYLCIAPKDVAWSETVKIYYNLGYSQGSLSQDGQGTEAPVKDGKYWIPVSLSNIDEGAFGVYLKMISPQAGTMNYDLQLYSEDKKTQLAVMANKSLTFLGDQTYVFAPDPIVGEVNKPISFTWTPINVVPALEGKSATVLFRFQNMSSANTKLTYTVDGKEVEAICEDVNGYLNATVEIASLESVEYKFILETSVATQGTQLNSVYVSNIKVGENSIPLQINVTEIKVTAPVEAKPITWTFSPDKLEGLGGSEQWFSIIATNVGDYAGMNPMISLNIEGSLYDEVEVRYVPSDFTPVPLEVTKHPNWPDSNLCITTPSEMEVLEEGKEYKFIFRYIGGFEGNYPEIGDIQLESVTVNGTELELDPNAGIGYELTVPDLPIEVSGGEVSYEESHKGKIVNIHSDGIYVINEPDASVGELRIQSGGQVRLQQGLEVGKLSISHRIPANAWTTFGVPKSSQNIILGDGTDEILTSGVMASRMGYSNANDQEWTTSFEADLPVATAILLAQNAETESYIGLHNRQFYNDNAEPLVLPSRLNTTSPGNKVNGNYFEFVANPLWENLTIDGRAYVLNEATNSFELQESPTIPPFQAYMIASEAVMKQVSSLRIGDIPTSNEDLAVTGFRVWTESGHVCFETTEAKDVAVYSMYGVQQCRFERSVGVQRQQLPQGIYIVVCDGTAYKVSVK